MDVIHARRSLLNSIHAVGAEGGLIRFETDFSAKLKQCIAGSDTNPIVHFSMRNIVPSDAVYTPNYFIDSSGVVKYSSIYRMYDKYIPIISGLTYSIRFIKNTSENIAFTVPFYNSNRVFIDRAMPFSPATDTGLCHGTFVAPSDAAYIKFSLPKMSQNVQIEIGNAYTDYEDSAATKPANEIKTHIGTNVIWSESGNLDLIYWTY